MHGQGVVWKIDKTVKRRELAMAGRQKEGSIRVGAGYCVEQRPQKVSESEDPQ